MKFTIKPIAVMLFAAVACLWSVQSARAEFVLNASCSSQITEDGKHGSRPFKVSAVFLIDHGIQVIFIQTSCPEQAPPLFRLQRHSIKQRI